MNLRDTRLATVPNPDYKPSSQIGAPEKDKSKCETNQSHEEKIPHTPQRITLLAFASTSGGIATPIWLAVLRLSAKSNFVGCTSVSSPGFLPLKIWSTYSAARRERSGRLTP